MPNTPRGVHPINPLTTRGIIDKALTTPNDVNAPGADQQEKPMEEDKGFVGWLTRPSGIITSFVLLSAAVVLSLTGIIVTAAKK